MKMGRRMWGYTFAVFSAGLNFSCVFFSAIHHDSIGVLIGCALCAAMIAWANWVRVSPRFDEAQNKGAAE